MNKIKDQECNYVNQHLADMANDTPVKMTFTNTGGLTSDMIQNKNLHIDNNQIQNAETYKGNKGQQFL